MQNNSAKQIKTIALLPLHKFFYHIQHKTSWQKISLGYLLKQQNSITPALKIPVDLYIKVSKLQRRFKNEVS